MKVNLFEKLLGIKHCFVRSNGNSFVGGGIHEGADRLSDASRERLCFYESFSFTDSMKGRYGSAPCYGWQVQWMRY